MPDITEGQGSIQDAYEKYVERSGDGKLCCSCVGPRKKVYEDVTGVMEEVDYGDAPVSKMLN